MARRTGLVWHERMMWNDTGKHAGILVADYPVQPGRPHENVETKRRLKNLLDASGFTEQLMLLRPRAATRDELARVHTAAYLDKLDWLNDQLAGNVGVDADVTKGGVDIAKLAAGGCLAAVDAIMKGQVDNAYALVRPIGHHAEPNEGKGFCILANPSLAAAHVLSAHGVRRVAIVDIDVHHGNGAETTFWRDPRVLTISVHQAGWFPPDRGDLAARGEGPGFGTNLNIPLPAGSGIGAYQSAMSRVILPALRRFQPEFLIVPCGYDASVHDQLGRMMLDAEAYRSLATQFVAAAGELTGGRLLVTHEGGYNESMVPFLGLAVLEAMSGIDSGVVDPHRGFFTNAPGQELQPHQAQLLDAAARFVAEIPGPSPDRTATSLEVTS
jgi:acetoin utilization deacetylase AcuC-like enzyme